MFRYIMIILTLLSIILVACSSAAAKPATPKMINTDGPGPSGATPTPTDQSATTLRDLGEAPELQNTVWLNTDQPLRLADLRGKVVLLDMWTFECINCQHVQPYLNQWYRDYASQGLVIIGNHFPEFLAERDLNNLKAAVKEQGILYPVAQDNDGMTWEAYHNAYWPTIYLIDKRGHIRYTHIGEGAYAITETAIQDLLNEPDGPQSTTIQPQE